MLTVEDILLTKGPDVIVAPPGTTVQEATRLMAAANVGALIVRQEQQPLGIFSERDLLTKVVAAGKNPATLNVEEVMTHPIVTCGLEDDIDLCGSIMHQRHIRHLAVVEEGVLIGMISLRDILTAAVREGLSLTT